MPGNSVRIQSAMWSWSSMSKARKRCTNSANPAACAIVLHPPERLREIGLPAPDRDVQRTLRRAGIDALDEPARAFGVVSVADVLASALRVAGLDALPRVPPPSASPRRGARGWRAPFHSRDDLADEVGRASWTSPACRPRWR